MSLGTTLRAIGAGVAAGAAGTTALNAVTYGDMALRARPSSSTPADTVEALAEHTDGDVPGQGEDRDNRVSALGALTGLGAGVGTGLLLGLARAAGFRPPVWVTGAVTTVGVLVASNGPMAALGVSDPRTWNANAWITDVVPHLAYALTATAVIEAIDR